MPDLKWYVIKLADIVKELDAAGMHFVSSSTKLHVATAILTELAKDERVVEMKAARMEKKAPEPPKPTEEEPATQAQLDYIRTFGVEPRAGLTKKEASELISRLKGVK